MEKLKANIIDRLALVVLPIMVLACYHQFERGLFNFYEAPFDFFGVKAIDLIIFIGAFAVTAGLFRLFAAKIFPITTAFLFVAILLSPVCGFKAASLRTTYEVWTEKP